MDWEECKIKRFVKEGHIDKELLTSLKKISDRKDISVEEGKFLIEDIIKLRKRLLGVLNEK